MAGSRVVVNGGAPRRGRGRWFCLVTATALVAGLLASSTVADAAPNPSTELGPSASPSSVPGHGLSDVPAWVNDPVSWLIYHEYANGYPDGTFKPNRFITRAELTNMLWGVIDPATPSPPHSFSDVPIWVETAVNWIVDPANQPPYATGYPDGTFKPRRDITRAQVARMIYRLQGAPAWGTTCGGLTDIPLWAADAICWLVDNGHASGYPDSTFKPDIPISRAQTARILYRVYCEGTGPGHGIQADDPPGDDIDANCDGLDGQVEDSVFVHPTGADGAACGTQESPCATVDHGQARAQVLAVTDVLLAGGTYAPFTLNDGLSVVGGYGAANWQRGPDALGATDTIIDGDLGAGSSPVAVTADGLTSATSLTDVQVLGADAGAGEASYAVKVLASGTNLTLDQVHIVGGTGGAGTAGTNGTGATQTAATAGNPGENSEEIGSVCSTHRKSGGSGSGGAGTGGDGGSQDSSCTLGVCAGGACNATAGLAGSHATTNTASCGRGGAGGGPGGNPAGNGTAGQTGCVSDGSGGSAGGPTNGTYSAGAWAPSGGTGGAGTNGSAGGAGGGGGGGGGSDESNDDEGGGGGSGGHGGAPATAAGTGGGPGHAAIALLIDTSSPTLTGLEITLGTGGTGGAGGEGGLGQPGGAGGAGGKGLCGANDTYPGYPYGNCPTGGHGGAGGNGGAGGHGGHSGGGGGGAGGPTFGIVRHANATGTFGILFNGGAGGAGGAGGGTGVAGATGQAGLLQQVIDL